jgi:hypothetical protein
MSNQPDELATLENVRPRILLTGALLGLGLGVLSAYLILKRAEEKGENPSLTVGDGVRIGMTVFTLIRTVSQL